ncbi:MAG TPA: CotH kinase family protein [Bacteroidia bacterium]|nr:CotH kinase family protein [Bacteroidia bacterium]
MKRLFPLLFILLSSICLKAQPALYDISSIRQIELTFTQPNWDYMMDTAAGGSEGYIIAAQIVIDGTVFDSVGVKYKGNSSYNANNNKNPMHIKLDYVHGGADYQGYTDLKLSNVFKDPSFVREALSYEILRLYMHAPQSNYARVKINGSYYGLYVSSEDIGKGFVYLHFYSSNGTFFKCNPIGGAGPGGGSTPTLVYQGSDSSLYQTAYELKSTYGWNDLVAFIDSLNNQPSGIISSLDVDRALWMLAFNNVFVNLDSYTGGFSQNYYLYKDANQRMNTVVWDLNESFGAFTNSGLGNLSITQEQQMSPLIHETNSGKPLISKLLSNPEYKRRYLAHMRTILTENFSNGNYASRAQYLQSLVDSSVQADPYKFYTYTQFQNSLTTAVTGGMGSIPGITQLMGARTTWLLAQSQFTAVHPVITSVFPSNAYPPFGGTVDITCTITNATVAKLGYRDAVWKKFNYVQMYDDGLHNDGGAGDGIYGASMTVTSPAMQYYVYAENGNAGMFSPERAEYEFYTLYAIMPLTNIGDVMLNEFMADNATDTTDYNGAHEDWIEVYNTTGNTLNMDGLYLSDNPLNLNKWPFPYGTTIAPYGHLIVFADEDDALPTELHCNFKLASSGEEIILSDITGTQYDIYVFGQQVTDYSMRRCPEGVGPWAPTVNPTPDYTNDCPVGIEEVADGQYTLFPNPAVAFATLTLPNSVQEIWIADVTGRIVYRKPVADLNEVTFSTAEMPAGIYFVFTDTGYRKKLVVEK